MHDSVGVTTTADLRMGAPYSRLVRAHATFARALAAGLDIPPDAILPTAGATGAIESFRNHGLATSGRSTLRVLSLCPEYWRALESFAGFGLALLRIDTEQNGFNIREAELAARAAELEPDLIYLSLPNNPTGAIFDPAEILARIGEERKILIDLTLPRDDVDLWQFTGDLYRRFEGREGLFLSGSTSKSHGTAEHRIGWLIGTAAHDMERLRQQNRNTVSVRAAQVGGERIGEKSRISSAIRASFELLERAEKPGLFALVRPDRRVQSSYVLVRLEQSSQELRQRFAARGIQVMWGSEFGLTDRYLRLETSEPSGIEAFLQALV